MDPQVFHNAATNARFGGLAKGAIGLIIAGIVVIVMGLMGYQLVYRHLVIPFWLGPLLLLAGILLFIFVYVTTTRSRYEVTGQILRYFRNDTMVYEVFLPGCRGTYQHNANRANTSAQILFLQSHDGSAPLKVDCTGLSATEYDTMLALLQQRGLQLAAPQAAQIPVIPTLPMKGA